VFSSKVLLSFCDWLYISEQFNDRLVRIHKTGGRVETILNKTPSNFRIYGDKLVYLDEKLFKGTDVYMYDLKSHQNSFIMHRNGINSFAISPEGAFLLTNEGFLGRDHNLLRINLDGSPTAILESKFKATPTNFSMYQNELYVNRANQGVRLDVLDRNGRKVRQVAPTTPLYFKVDKGFVADGRYFFMNRHTVANSQDDFDIYYMDLRTGEVKLFNKRMSTDDIVVMDDTVYVLNMISYYRYHIDGHKAKCEKQKYSLD
jgi:hypothetical protein